MIFKPYNLALHEHLMSLGYEYQRFACTFEDAGDAENGPHLTGGPAYDMYSSPTEFIYATEGGVLDHEDRNLAFEKMMAEMNNDPHYQQWLLDEEQAERKAASNVINLTDAVRRSRRG